MKPRGSPSATVLTEGKTLPWSSADLDFFNQVNKKRHFAFRAVCDFSVINMYLKKVAVDEMKHVIVRGFAKIPCKIICST